MIELLILFPYILYYLSRIHLSIKHPLKLEHSYKKRGYVLRQLFYWLIVVVLNNSDLVHLYKGNIFLYRHSKSIFSLRFL